MSRLEMIDVIRERTGLGYARAARLLDESGGDLIEALCRYEEEQEREEPTWKAAVQTVTDRIKELVQEGNVTRIRIKRGEKTLVELPVTAGVVGALIAPNLAMVGAAACLLTRCTVEIHRGDGELEEHPISYN